MNRKVDSKDHTKNRKRGLTIVRDELKQKIRKKN